MIFCHNSKSFNRSPWQIKIIVGTNQWKSGGTKYTADKVIVHKKYNSPAYANDIALIRMRSPIEFNESVQPIAYTTKEVPAGEILQAAGWGAMQVGFFYSIFPAYIAQMEIVI